MALTRRDRFFLPGSIHFRMDQFMFMNVTHNSELQFYMLRWAAGHLHMIDIVVWSVDWVHEQLILFQTKISPQVMIPLCLS